MQNESERPVKKNDHAVDSLRYLIMTRPNKPITPKQELTRVQGDIASLMKPQNLSVIWDND
jgi:hypothetical protein